MSRLSSETAALPAPAKLPTPTSQPLTPQPKAALSIAISGSDINIRATDGDIEIAAASSNLFLGEISFVETFNFYLNVSA